MPKLSVVFHFYRNFIIPEFAVSIISGSLIYQAKSYSYMLAFLLVKVFTNLIFFTLFHIFRQNILFFYNNLGYSNYSLFGLTLVVDMSVWLIIAVISFML